MSTITWVSPSRLFIDEQPEEQNSTPRSALTKSRREELELWRKKKRQKLLQESNTPLRTPKSSSIETRNVEMTKRLNPKIDHEPKDIINDDKIIVAKENEIKADEIKSEDTEQLAKRRPLQSLDENIIPSSITATPTKKQSKPATPRSSNVEKPEYDINLLLLANDTLVHHLAESESRRQAESSCLQYERDEMKLKLRLQELHFQMKTQKLEDLIEEQSQRIEYLTSELEDAMSTIEQLKKKTGKAKRKT